MWPPFIQVNLISTLKWKKDALITVFTLIINTLLISGKLPIIFSQAWVIPLSPASICYFWYVMHYILLCTYFSFFSALLEEDEFMLPWSLGTRLTLCSRMVVQSLALWCVWGVLPQSSSQLWRSTIWLLLHNMSVYRHGIPHWAISVAESLISAELPVRSQECILKNGMFLNSILWYNLPFGACIWLLIEVQFDIFFASLLVFVSI